jgi:hypothetical protein
MDLHPCLYIYKVFSFQRNLIKKYPQNTNSRKIWPTKYDSLKIALRMKDFLGIKIVPNKT